MRRLLPIVLLSASLASPSAFAWGFGGNSPPTRVPVPSRVLHAAATDSGGTTVELTSVSFDGEILLFGTLGKAQVAIELERVATIDFSAGPNAEHRLATAHLVDGGEAKVIVEADLPLYGRAVFGNYRIYAEDLRQIVMRP